MDRHREIIYASLLGNCNTAFNTRKIDKSGLDDALLAFGGLDD